MLGKKLSKVSGRGLQRSDSLPRDSSVHFSGGLCFQKLGFRNRAEGGWENGPKVTLTGEGPKGQKRMTLYCFSPSPVEKLRKNPEFRAPGNPERDFF